MLTPFDPALRIQQRALDALRISLLAETACQQALADERTALDSQLRDEAKIAAANWQVGAHPYVQRVRVRRCALERETHAVDGRLAKLRDAAMNASGQMLAITEAASRFVSDLRRNEAAADQSHIDDLIGARYSARVAGGYRP